MPTTMSSPARRRYGAPPSWSSTRICSRGCMSMNEHLVFMLQLLITGVAVGGVYALMALGFVLIYKASNVVNFGPGELVLFGAYVSWATILLMRFPLYVAFPLTLLTSIALGLIIERGVLRPLIRSEERRVGNGCKS